jgi:hypothetical protein
MGGNIVCLLVRPQDDPRDYDLVEITARGETARVWRWLAEMLVKVERESGRSATIHDG